MSAPPPPRGDPPLIPSEEEIRQALLLTAENANASAVARFMLAQTSTGKTNAHFMTALQALTSATEEYQSAFEEADENAPQLENINSLKEALKAHEDAQNEATKEKKKEF